MRSLTFNEVEAILKENKISYSNKFIFIESGTYKGATIFNVSKHWDYKYLPFVYL